MSLYMDVHNNLPDGTSAADVAGAHAADLRVQERYGVRYLNYWVDEEGRKVFCLIEAPNADAAHATRMPRKMISASLLRKPAATRRRCSLPISEGDCGATRPMRLNVADMRVGHVLGSRRDCGDQTRQSGRHSTVTLLWRATRSDAVRASASISARTAASSAR